MVFFVKTTLNLDPALIRAAKEVAARSGRTLTSIIEDALRHSLNANRGDNDVAFELVTSPGNVRPGIELDDSASLLDALEDDVPA